MHRRLAWAALGVLAATAADADWLVLKDGTRMETRGEWKQKGRQIRFETPDGKFQALPLTEVDLEASRKATPPPADESREERLFKGEAVELPPVQAGSAQVSEQEFGDSLRQYILDPDAPRIDPKSAPIASESRLEMAYERQSRLLFYRRLAICSIGEAAVQQLEADFEQGQLAGLDRCYDKDRYPTAEHVDVCLGDVLGEALRGTVQSGADPCRTRSSTDDD